MDASQAIIRRNIALTYTTGSCAAAKAVLQRLHNSAYRCMLDNVSLDMDSNGGAAVSGTIVFFE